MRVSPNMLILTVLALIITACVTSSEMTTGPSVLGADGQVNVADGPNGNTLVKVAIRHLAPAEKVAAGATVYVAWIQSGEGGSPQNVGQIRLDDDRAGVLETLTPFKTFTLTVTAEPLATAASRTSPPVLTAKIAPKP